MHFLRVPAGSFTMGSPPSEAGRKQDEAQHVVTLTHPFWLCTTEVTARQYAIVMGQPAPKRGNFELPVSDVSWDDSIEFCKILGAKEGVPYRLPTEAEWEYACRAGTIEPFSGTGDIHQFAWFKGKSGGHLHPVGSLQPNDFGLFDMHGGVAEWCSDGYEPFSDRPQIDPRGRDGSLVRIVRGGSFEQSAEDCRSASRQAFPRNYKAEDVGFRVIIDRLQTNPSF
jgi:formylglycine-generating enzyme required for sulfatase activity